MRARTTSTELATSPPRSESWTGTDGLATVNTVGCHPQSGRYLTNLTARCTPAPAHRRKGVADEQDLLSPRNILLDDLPRITRETHRLVHFCRRNSPPQSLRRRGSRGGSLKRVSRLEASNADCRLSPNSAAASRRSRGSKRRVACPRSLSESRTAWTNRSTSAGRTSRSSWGEAISRTPPTSVATNEVPQAIDSSSTLGTPSLRLVKTVTFAARYQSASDSCGRLPGNRHDSQSPSCRA